MGDLKEILDKEFGSVTDPDDDQRKQFCKLLKSYETIDRDDFTTAVGYAINYFGMMPDLFHDELGVCLSSVRRWAAGKSAPIGTPLEYPTNAGFRVLRSSS